MDTISIEEEPITSELTQKIDTGFLQHGFEVTGFNEPIFRTAFSAKDGTTFAGCAVVCVLWGVLRIQSLFVEAPYRRGGLGTKLLNKGIEYGKALGCTVAFVETLSFQALVFYQKLGFELEFTRKGFSHGVTLHYLKKDLSQ
jgi:GNAT superfamily N-acetyltransferase